MAFARELAPKLQHGDVLALCGELGAGKTHFVKGLAEGLGYIEEVTSPTFTLVHEYVGGIMSLYHFDFYRIDTEAEALDLGLEDYLGTEGACVIEWGDKFPDLLPAHTRWFHIRIGPGEARTITENS